MKYIYSKKLNALFMFLCMVVVIMGYWKIGDLPAYAAGTTTAPLVSEVTVHNYITGIKDNIIVSSLTSGDVVKVYNAATDGTLIGSVTAQGSTATVTNLANGQLGTGSGTVYVTKTSNNMSESSRTAVPYTAEPVPWAIYSHTGNWGENYRYSTLPESTSNRYTFSSLPLSGANATKDTYPAFPNGDDDSSHNINNNKHIIIKQNGTRVTFYGYGMPSYKDFIFLPTTESTSKAVSFNIDLSTVSFHTVEGAGFLFNIKKNSNGNLDGYALLIVGGIDSSTFYEDTSQRNINLYKLTNVSPTALQKGNATTSNSNDNDSILNVSGVSKVVYSSDSNPKNGDATLVFPQGRTILVNSNVHYIKLQISQTEIVMQDSSTAGGTFSTIMDYKGLTGTGTNGVGLIASYLQHGCSILSSLTFNNVVIQDSTWPIMDLTATSSTTPGQINLSYTAPTDADVVVIQKSTDGTNFSTAETLNPVSPTDNSATVTGLTNNTAYTIRVLVGGGENAGISNTATVTPTGTVTTTTYTVTFNGNGATTDASPTTKTATYGGNVGTLPAAPSRTGYTFTGWNKEANGTGTAFDATTSVIGSMTVYAQWNLINYTVTFDSNGATTDASPTTETAAYGGNVGTLPAAPSKTGSTFTGWNTTALGTGSAFDATTAVTDDIKVYAQWKAISTIAVGNQSGTITAGTAGSATFAATTANIADGTAVTGSWCDASGNAATAPTGLTVSGTNVSSDASTITVTADATAVAGTYYFKAASDTASSSLVTVTVASPPAAKSVAVGTQSGTITAGTAGSATFTATTANIADGTAVTGSWYDVSGNAVTAPTGLTVSGTNVSSDATTITVTADATAVAGTYYFKAASDTASSSLVTVTVASPPAAESVAVGNQSGTITAGTAGSATFAATTANIADGTAVMGSWCDASGNAATAPTGLTVSGTNVSSDASTITVTADATAVAGTYYFKAASDTASSSLVTVTVASPPAAKSIAVGTQSGTITAGTAGSATFAGTTANIADGTAVTGSWCDASGNAVTAPTGLTISGTNVSSDATTITVTADATAVAGTYYFKTASDTASSSLVTVTVASAANNNYTLQLVAVPAAIVGNGKDETLLTATVTDKDGNAVEGVDVVFSSSNYNTTDNFIEGYQKVTGENGKASIYYRSSNLEPQYNTVAFEITAKVDDSVLNLHAQDTIAVTFVPGTIKGIVYDDITGKPLSNTAVEISLDSNGKVFTTTVTTDANGAYSTYVPWSGETYSITVDKAIETVDENGNTQTTEVPFTQQVTTDASQIGQGGTFNSEKTVTGIVMQKDYAESSPGAVKSSLLDSSMLSKYSVLIEDNSGATIQTLKLQNNGIFTADNLNIGTYSVAITYVADDGQVVVAGNATVSISSDGEMTISRILIDPYGTITDSDTGNSISNAYVTLYYANTANNIAKGKSGVVTDLPVIPGFAPNNNVNPDKDADGYYAFMVFPDTDYYVVAKASGYQTYTSGTLSVGKTILKQNIVMEKIVNSHGGSSSSGSSVPATITTPTPTPTKTDPIDLAIAVQSSSMSVIDNNNVVMTITYANKTGVDADGVYVETNIPSSMSFVSADNGGVLTGNVIRWPLDTVKGNTTGKLNFILKVKDMTTAEDYATISSKIGSDKSLNLINLEDNTSFINLKLYSTKYEHEHKRYIKGYPDGEVKPENLITRAEVAVIFARTLNLESNVTKTREFSDVASNYWASDFIEAVAKEGIFKGYPDGSFKPDQSITRAELATVIAKYLGITKDNGMKPILKLSNFTDTNGHWAERSIEEIFRYGIASGLSKDTFKPDQNITREEAIKMINRMLYRGPLINAEQSFPDNNKSRWSYGDIEEATRTHYYTLNGDGTENMTKYVKESLW